MKRKILFAGAIPLLLLSLSPLISTGQQANAAKDIFLKEKGCPLVSVSPVTGSALALKNVGRKTIASYTLACFSPTRKEKKLDLVFNEPVDYTIPPGESMGVYGFDATPPNICRARKTLIGVYEVKFSDGTTWVTTALR